MGNRARMIRSPGVGKNGEVRGVDVDVRVEGRGEAMVSSSLEREDASLAARRVVTIWSGGYERKGADAKRKSEAH
jgi:hypothetical protein